jgi:outer membrane protein assembly factor BamA
LVREQLEIQAEQPLDISALARSRRNLYDTGAFSIVDITREEIGSGRVSDLQENGNGRAADQKPLRLTVSVREVQPIQLRYGASYDTERGLGGILDVANHNSLGKARVIGLRSRYDSQLREGRLYLSQPSLRYFPVQLTGTLYFREERNPATEITDGYDVDRKGFSLQGETELRDQYVWSYGYRYERARTFEPELGGVTPPFTVSPLTSTFTREARDEALDATRGSFMSQAFGYSPSWLGSDRPYLRYFGQYFHYFPLQRERREKFTNEILRPRFVFATGVRLGVARGLGGVVPPSERFFAGGSTTLRGFSQNVVGPIGANRVPSGGNAMLIINNELRFPLMWIVDGVVFTDIGNVFPRVGDFSFSDLRETAGAGVRVRTPWFLLRGDYGFVLDRRPNELRGRFYFSIGQAF